MGTWSHRILDDDFAQEVVSSFVERLYAGDDAAAATRAVIAEHGELDVDERTVFWLALATVQHDYGRLVESVKREALAIIALGEDLDRWAGDAKRARAVAALARKLEGPARPIKRLAKRPPKLKEGDVFRLPLGEGRYAFGRVLTDGERAFYRFVSEEKRPALDDIVGSEVLFVVGSTDDGFARRRWFVIGNRPLEPRLRVPTYFLHRPVGSAVATVFDIWDRRSDERRPLEDCQGIEIWGAWSSNHCADRVADALAGRPCKWVQRA